MTQPFAINSLGSLIRWCPICERFHHRKRRVTRQSANDYGICASCGWKWHPLGCHCKECRQREAKREEERAERARKAEADANVHGTAH